MDFLKELTKQTSKILNNVTSTFEEITNLATNSATSAGSMVVVKGKVETEKAKLYKLYQDLGELVVNHPDEDYSELASKIKALQDKIDSLEKSYDALKTTVANNTKEIKDKVVNNTETLVNSSKEDLKKDSEDLKDFVLSESEKLDKKIDEKIEEIEIKVKSEK